MSSLHPDMAYSLLAGVAVGGLAAPLLFPMAAGLKTASLVSSIAASGCLAYAHSSGLIDDARERQRVVRDSNKELFYQRAASREALALRKIEIDELVEVLVMLDELTPAEQRHFLNELGMPELIEVYQPAQQPLELADHQPREMELVNVETQSSQLPEMSSVNILPDRAFFPIANLPRELAQCDRQLVEVSCPGGGKTRFQLAFAAEVFDLSNGSAQCIVIDAKGSPFARAGVKHYLHCNTTDNIPQALALIESVINIMIDRQNYRTQTLGGTYENEAQKPPELLLVLGELNDILELALQYDKSHKGCDLSDKILLAIARIFRQGREDRVRILADMHSFNASDIKAKSQKMSAAMFSNAVKLALSRGGDATAIDKFLSYYSQGGESEVKECRMMIEQYQSECADKSVPLVATALGGLRIVQLPFVELGSLYREWKPINFAGVGQHQASAEFDRNYQETHGVDPDVEMALDDEQDFWEDKQPEDMPKAPKPSSIPPDSPLALLIHSLRQWMATLPTLPDDAMLAAKLLEVTGQKFGADAIAGLKGELGLG